MENDLSDSTLLAGTNDQSTMNATTVFSRDQHEVNNETSYCDVAGDASSLVISSVVGGREAEKMAVMEESVNLDSDDQQDGHLEFCTRGGSIQNVLLQGDLMSFTAPSIQLEVHVESDSYKVKASETGSFLAAISRKSSHVLTDHVNTKLDSCSSSNNASQVPCLSTSNLTNTKSDSKDMHSLDKVAIKKEPLWSSTSMESASNRHCSVNPTFPGREQCRPRTQQRINETERYVVTSSTASEDIFRHNIPVNREQISSVGKKDDTNSRSINTDTCEGTPVVGIVQRSRVGDLPEKKSSINTLDCPVCGASLSRQQTLKLHLRSHYGYDPYKCRECKKVFSDSKQLEQHILGHKGIKPYVCIHCGKSFLLKRNHAVHLQFHVENSLKDLLCCICGEEFETKQSLVNHIGTHTDVQMTCKQCGKILPTSIDILIHTRSHDHQQIKNLSFTSFQRVTPDSDTNTRFIPHIADDRNDVTSDVIGIIPHIADVTSDVIGNESSDVTNDVTGNAVMSTEVCLEAGFRDVRKVEARNKTLSCSVCDQTFKNATELVAHRFQHVGENDKDRIYECVECDSKFKKSWHLKEHMRRHSGIKFYACNVCGKKFKRSNQRTRHKKGHFTSTNTCS